MIINFKENEKGPMNKIITFLLKNVFSNGVPGNVYS